MISVIDQLPRSTKRAIMVVFDLCAIVVAVWASFALRMGQALPDQLGSLWWVLLVMPLLTVPILASLHLYRSVIRYLGPRFCLALFQGITLSALCMVGIAFMSRAAMFPRTAPIIYWLMAALLIGGSRLVMRWYFRSRMQTLSKPVIIYGAGVAGARLVSAIVNSREYNPVAIVDDDRELWKNDIRGVRVHSPADLPHLIKALEVSDIFLALPSVSRRRRFEIVEELRPLEVGVSSIPELGELVMGSARYDEIRPIRIEDLLGRDPVQPDASLLSACATDKSVMVTGAGGSIGSELCRQLLRLRPTRLVLVEQSEFALYEVEQSLRAIAESDGLDVEILPLLGNICDQVRMKEVIDIFQVQTIYHAAAYKHVPIVEYNIVEGVRNNTIGTWRMAQAAIEQRVETFVLISTDKAVRPTNAMGATKRLAELVLQGLSRLETPTRFCMVRFGNVLDSSGSVVPLFREQIQAGGPVTVTHPEIIRYFMTIPEAAQLVIQAGAMGDGGDVFVLDMGEPVKIVDLARTMIRLAGLSEKTDEHPEGDIALEFTGLRPGEKLYEELLIGQNTSGTPHRQILRASEDDLPWEVMEPLLADLESACLAMDCDVLRARMRTFVHGYKPAADLVDLAWLRRRARDNADTLQFPSPQIEVKPAASLLKADPTDAVS
ncbi:MAG: nucleoside-diphosphate sugar epimerase/dehydratase [Phycisphaerales bacterium]|nr:nucleoside-diphosphate sugar epimerase/dehydratase [Phycisphaerales bacterium]